MEASTVLSFPPEAPIAIRSPRWKSVWEMMVWWISSSKAERKHNRQSFWWVAGRMMMARLWAQWAQGVGGMILTVNTLASGGEGGFVWMVGQ